MWIWVQHITVYPDIHTVLYGEHNVVVQTRYTNGKFKDARPIAETSTGQC